MGNLTGTGRFSPIQSCHSRSSDHVRQPGRSETPFVVPRTARKLHLPSPESSLRVSFGPTRHGRSVPGNDSRGRNSRDAQADSAPRGFGGHRPDLQDRLMMTLEAVDCMRKPDLRAGCQAQRRVTSWTLAGECVHQILTTPLSDSQVEAATKSEYSPGDVRRHDEGDRCEYPASQQDESRPRHASAGVLVDQFGRGGERFVTTQANPGLGSRG